MLENKWFCTPDTHRESWCFLKIEYLDGDGTIVEARIGYANPSRIVRRVAIDNGNEREILHRLIEELHFCRKKDIRIILFNSKLMKILRTRMVAINFPSMGLRNIYTTSIKSIWEEFFVADFFIAPVKTLDDLAAYLGIQQTSQDDTQLLWLVFTKLAPLIPEVSEG